MKQKTDNLNRFNPALAGVAAIMLAVICCLPGCLGYRLGSTLPDDIRSVFVPVFENRSGEPLLEQQVTSAVIAEIQKDGNLTVKDENAADTVLRVTIRGFQLQPVRYEHDERRTAAEYRLTITAEILFTRNTTGKTLSKGTVYGETTFAPAADMMSSKRRAIPDAADDLARQIVKSMIEIW